MKESLKNKEIISLFKIKLQSKHKPLEIGESLLRMGYSKKEINDAYTELRLSETDIHQHIVATYDFLPPLKKGSVSVVTVYPKKTSLSFLIFSAIVVNMFFVVLILFAFNLMMSYH